MYIDPYQTSEMEAIVGHNALTHKPSLSPFCLAFLLPLLPPSSFLPAELEKQIAELKRAVKEVATGDSASPSESVSVE